MRNINISEKAKAMYNYIVTTNNPGIGNHELKKFMKVSETTIRKYLRELEAAGFITVDIQRATIAGDWLTTRSITINKTIMKVEPDKFEVDEI